MNKDGIGSALRILLTMYVFPLPTVPVTRIPDDTGPLFFIKSNQPYSLL